MSLIRAKEMELILHTLIVLELSWIANSFNVYEPARVPGWNYFGHSWTDHKPSFVFRKPMAAMVDLTNDLGVAILQDYSYSRSNFAFSPYGVASVLVVLYEGARGESARQIHRAVKFPWDKDITRIGFRDIHRHLRSYFSHEGYLSGITLSKDGSSLKSEYKRILRFYGYDVDVDTPERTSEAPLTTTVRVTPRPTTNSTTPGVATTEGYDITKGKDPEETNIAASTIKPEDTTMSSSDETMTALTTMEDRESPVSPTTMMASSSTTETATESSTEGQISGMGPEQNTQESQNTEETSPSGSEQNTGQGAQEDTQQSTQGGSEQDAVTEESTQGQDTGGVEGTEENAEQSNVQDTQQSTEEVEGQGSQQSTEVEPNPSTAEGNEQDSEQGLQQNTDQNTEGNNVDVENNPVDSEQNAEQVEEQTTQKDDEQTTQGSDTNGEGNKPVGTEQNAQKVEEQTTQKPVEQTTHESEVIDERDKPVGTEQIAEQVEEQTTQKNDEQTTQGSDANSEGVKPVDTEQNAEKVDLQTPQQSTLGTTVPPVPTEQNTEAHQQDPRPETEEASMESSPQNTEETPPTTNQQPAEPEMTPSTTQTKEDSTTPVMESDEPVNTEPTTEDGKTTSSTDEVEVFTVSTPTNIEEALATLQEAEIVGNLTTEEGDRISRSDALDNGMLIPQYTNGQYSYFDDRLGLAYTNPEKRNLIDDTVKRETTSEDWKEIGVALIAEGDEVKWEPKTLDEFLKNLMISARESGDRTNRTRRLASGNMERRRRQESNSGRVSPEETLLLRGESSTGKRLPVIVETSAKLKRRRSSKEKRNISEFLKVPPVTDLSLQLQNGMFDSHVSKDTDLYRVLPKFLFLVDGAIDTPVPMMTYTNVFPFAYIPRLHCKALEFPLDDERYKLLILLPVERRGLRQLIYDLGSYPLREVMDVLRPARVKAMVPTFMVEGFVILTPTLQKMGIWDVFDPRRSDLSGMTSDPDLYVRNIEQSVTVVIRNYVEILDIQTRTMAARHIDEDFTASHPFLYFVMDTATNVALMAGQMLDPLNSRIY